MSPWTAAASQSHVDKGQKLRQEGKLEEALTEFQKAFGIDPASSIAEQEMRRTSAMIEREKALKSTPGAEAPKPEERGLTLSEVARKAAEKRAASIMSVPELKPLSREITGLKMVNRPTKVLYETLGKLTGINVLFDAEYNDTRHYSIDLSRTTLDEALDYLALLTKTYVKPLSSNAIFVTQDNVTKRRDYEEQVTRIFYLQNLTSPQELQEVMTGMRTVTDVRKVFPINSQSAIVVRGTVDQVALAEKVLMDLDKAKPEVIVDVLVMEANKTRTRDLAATPTSGGKSGLSANIAYSPAGTGTGTAAAPSGVRLNSLGSIGTGDWVVNMPGYMVQALMKDSSTKVLTTPQVRATDGQKASLRLGDRYPYATGSFQPGMGAVGVSPLVQTQFQFAEVGINVDLTPRIHAGDEVSMQVEFEISNIRDRIDVGGLSQPVIGQRKVNHIIRVKEGEVTLIGGLMQATSSKVRSGVPFLMNVPWLGRLFSSENIENNNAELLVALVPHIVRTPDITAENIRTIATGTESIYKLNYAQPAAMPQAPAAAKPGTGPAGLPALPVKPSAGPAAAPGTETPRSGPPLDATPPPVQGNLAQSPDVPGIGRPTAGAGTPVVALRASATEVPQNATVTVSVNVDNVAELFSSPMRLKYDNKVLKLVEISKGAFLGGDGQQITFSESRVDEAGTAIINMNRVPGAGGISGSGTLVTLKFQAVGKGVSAVSFEDLTLRDARLQPIAVTPPSTAITVK
ncbi:MAG: hypothetical protein HZB13_13610 [Acidobacteria bacterium]|nr:hypothetical protein [Acidobacteriota bacterium]